jgi:SAM-dependent methyltransferase
MFGWGDEFEYFCCSECGCLQICKVPENLARFYPPIYYSFHLQPIPRQGVKSWLGGKRDLWAATRRGPLGFLVNAIIPARIEVASLGGVPARREMRILDVGCGSGQLLSILHRAGMENLQGIDPYLAADVEVLPGLWVRKQALDDVSGAYDLIMLHHVFEHVEDGRKLLAAACSRLTRNGKILLRFPTPESEAWKRYEKNWVQIDAPRHLVLHTRKSLEVLAEQTGLSMERCWCDSSAMQFWASELYKKGVSLYDEKGVIRDPVDYFTKAEIKEFNALAKNMNASGRGDQLVVILKANSSKSDNV